MNSEPTKAKKWKRIFVLLSGLLGIAVAVTLFFLASDSAGNKVAKFALLPAVCLGGIWLIFASLRGRAGDVDPIADRFIYRRRKAEDSPD